jgi:PAS domain S-box-containing protein
MASASHPQSTPKPEIASLPDPGRQLLQIVSAMQAVDSTKAAGERLRPGERRYRELLDSLGVAVYTTDSAGRITFFNTSAASFWGRRPELGELWCGSWRLYWVDGRPMRHEECPMAIALQENREVRGYEAIAERPDGSRVTFIPYPTPLRNRDGALIGAVNVLVDVTERKQAEQALHAAAQELRASNAVKDEFLGLVSHELRTPVTTIFGNAQLLRERGDRLADEVKQTMVADIAEDSERLLGIIENLLLLTRLESGATPELEPQVLVHVVRKSVESFRRRHQGRSVTLTSEPGRDLIVEADRTYLELLLENLLSNADKYSPRGTEVEVVVGIREGEAHILVLDRGIGVGEEDTSNVFVPFYRTETAKKRANGIGIGLAVCKRVIESQGGRIWARPRERGGTEVGFAVPLTHDPGGHA